MQVCSIFNFKHKQLLIFAIEIIIVIVMKIKCFSVVAHLQSSVYSELALSRQMAQFMKMGCEKRFLVFYQFFKRIGIPQKAQVQLGYSSTF